jgi:hypothetical protein
VSQLSAQEQPVMREVLESLIIKYQARRWDSARVNATAAPAKKAATPRKKAAGKRSTPHLDASR